MVSPVRGPQAMAADDCWGLSPERTVVWALTLVLPTLAVPPLDPAMMLIPSGIYSLFKAQPA
jgi:hypothetical protein